MESNGSTLSINGLWALTPAPATASSLDPDVVFFTAGPNSGLHGVLGFLKLAPAVISTGGY